jgi:hypothetical protein
VHSKRTVQAALKLFSAGANASEIARAIGVPRRTVADWLTVAVPHSVHAEARCGRHSEGLGPSYVYLLGLYLGNGCISTHPRGVYRLRIFLDAKYPGIIASAAEAMSAVRSGRVSTQPRPQNCIEVSSYWKCWPCVFPQHGVGRKHARSIPLANWQRQLADRWPYELLRPLIHLDRCRFQNTGRNDWSCPRYNFSNRSADIREIFCRACEAVGVRWTASGKYAIYVSRKADVARLDEFIGPKR